MAFPDEPRGDETPSGEPAPPPQESTDAAVSGEVLTDTPPGEPLPEAALMVTPPPRPEPPPQESADAAVSGEVLTDTPPAEPLPEAALMVTPQIGRAHVCT